MRNVFQIPFKLVCKAAALILLSALTIFVYLYSVMVFFYRLMSGFFAAIGTCLISVECYQHGMNAERGLIILCLIGVVALRYLLPMLTPLMQRWQVDLTHFIYAPLTVRPPVRYTI